MKQRDALRAQAESSGQAASTSSPSCPPDRHTPAPPSAATAAADPDLAAALANVTAATSPHILIAVANGAYAAGPDGGLVGAWARSAAATHTPTLLFALDEDAAGVATAAGVPAFRVDLPIPLSQQQGQQGKGGGGAAAPPSNHAVSALKYGLARRVLALGYTLLMSDVDVLFLRNPFEEGGAGGGGAGLLPLGADVAASSDGWDAPSAYGWDDVHDEPGLGWGRHAHSTRILHLNSGLWAARPSGAAVAAVSLIEARVSAEPAWDQAVFNEVLLTPSHGAYASPGASLRVLEVDRFVNSRVLWARLGPAAVGAGRVPSDPATRPTAVHVNYHPEKPARLAAVAAFYLGGDVRALEGLPVGSTTTTSGGG
jgi:hypothetical protein